jgi:hypothetical protein
LTKQQIDEVAKKFVANIDAKTLDFHTRLAYAKFGLADQVLPFADKYDHNKKLLLISVLCTYYINKNNDE